MNKISSKMHLFIIISSIIVAIGIALGLIFEFAVDGQRFVNFGGDLGSYKAVTVRYALADLNEDNDFTEDTIKETCQEVFANNGVNANEIFAETLNGGEITYKFSDSTSLEVLEKCASEIEVAFGEVNMSSGLTSVVANGYKANLGAIKAIVACVIALVVVVIVEFIYFFIRYGLTAALSMLVALAHNAALFVALVMIVRIQVSSAIVTFVALTVFATLIGCAMLFNKTRAQFGDEQNKKLSATEIVDKGASQAFAPIMAIFAALAIAACIIALATMLGSLSLASLLMPALCAVICFAACLYGTALFTPSVYSRFATLARKIKADAEAKKN